MSTGFNLLWVDLYMALKKKMPLQFLEPKPEMDLKELGNKREGFLSAGQSDCPGHQK